MDLDPDERSWLGSPSNNGRLGNQLSSLATLLALSSDLDLVPVLTARQEAIISRYFQLESAVASSSGLRVLRDPFPGSVYYHRWTEVRARK